MDKVCVCYYYKCIVIKIDPFCDSCVIFDRNCDKCELNSLRSEIKQKYPSKNGYTSVFKKQSLSVKN